MSSYQSTKTANKSSSRISKDGNNKQSKQNEKIYHYAGKVHVRGLLRRVWRPRYLALGDDGYLRYHESIPPIFQQQTQYTQNMYNMVHHTHRPKSVLAILDGARVINPYSVVDQHVALPQGVYGFVFRGRPVELSVSSGNAGSKTSRDAVIVPTQNRGDAEKHKPAKAVVNAIFPKGTSRRKTAQKIAKAAINPDVCGIVRGCDRGHDNSDSSSSLMGYEQSLFDDDDEVDANVMQVHVQSASVQSREYLCAVSTAAEAESWVVALRWAAERRRMNKEQKRMSLHTGADTDQKFNSLGVGTDDKLIIMGTSDDKEGVGDSKNDSHYGQDSKESLTSTATEGSWCKTETEKRLSEKNEQVASSDATNKESEDSATNHSSSLHSFDDLGGDHESNNDSTLLPTPRAKNLLDSLLVEEKTEAIPPAKLFEEKQATKIDQGATIVITKVSQFQVQMNSALSQSLPIPLPGNSLCIRYQIELLLLRECETNDSTSDVTRDIMTNSKSVHPKSIEEQTLLKSSQDILRLVNDMKIEFGDDVETLEFLREVESSLLLELDLRMKVKPNNGFLDTVSDIIATRKAIDETTESVNRVMRSLSTHNIVCSSQLFQQFLCLDQSASSTLRDQIKIKQRPDFSGASIDQIVETWISINANEPPSDRAHVYLAITLHHPFAGPSLVLVSLWLTLRCIGLFWYIMTSRFPVISIPLETYLTLVMAAFYYGHGIGTRSSKSDILGITRGKSIRNIPDHIHDNSASSLPAELVDDDDHSTLVDEIVSDSDDALVLPEAESIHEPPVLSSPLPKFPENKGISCWSKPDHNIFMVRSKSYLNDRLKTPSAPAVFECRGVDIWLTDNAERNISRHPSMLGGRLHEEDTFIVNFLLPFANLVAYFSVKPMDQMPLNVVRVWQAFVKGDQEYRDSKLKLLPVVVDGPWIVKKAVGPGTSPAMLGKDLPLQYHFKEPNGTKKGVYEVDVLVTASRIARGILNVVKSHTQSLTIAFAFIIEASEEHDLPEQVLCAFQVHSLHLEDCPYLPEHSLGDP